MRPIINLASALVPAIAGALLAVSSAVTLAGEETPRRTEADAPLESGTVEKEQVRLVLLDVVVVDRRGRAIPELTLDDFEVLAGGKSVPVDTLDVRCSDAPIAEPTAVRHASKRELPRLPDASRKIVLAIDYLHLLPVRRAEVIERAREAVTHGVAPGDEIMVVALNGGLRIEQRFTGDRDEVLASLHRMEYDITLWQPRFEHLHESVFTEPMVALLDLLGEVPGNKAIVLYSTMRDVPLDTEFARIAAIASTSRCAIYPVDVAGLRTRYGGPDGAGIRGYG